MTPENGRILIVVPFYNNEKTVAGVVGGALGLGLPVLAVNDGSTDGGPRSLAGLSAERLDLDRNRGKGRAIRSALGWARDRGFSHVITIDADGQHSPTDIPRFLEAIKDSPEKLIIGRRNFRDDAPGKSRFGRGWSNMWVRIASGGITRDSQSGFRAYPVGPLASLKFIGSRYEFEVEALVKAVWAGVGLRDVDVTVQYFSGADRITHFKSFRDNFRISLMYTLLVSRNLLPVPFRRPSKGVISSSVAASGPDLDNPPERGRDISASGKVKRVLSFRRRLTVLRQLPPGRQPSLELGLAGGLGFFLRSLPLFGFQGAAIRLYARRFGLAQKVALSAGRLGAPFLSVLIPILAVEWGHRLRAGRWIGPAELGSAAKVVQTLGREAPQRLLEYLTGGLWIGFAGGLAVCLLVLVCSWRRRSPRGERT